MPGGWYHITTRGLGRRDIFKNDRDHEHFFELLAGMVERYNIILHAHAELDNHYHLLIESPEGNVSRAMQWLNTSYSVWFNTKYDRVGAFFQSRFKSIPVDNEGSWAFECAMYVHLNPVRLKSLGLGKEDRSREKAGMLPKEPEPELVLKRVETLRKHRWSSYPAYAGYVEKPAWLRCEELWRRGSEKGEDPVRAYREWVEDYLKQGVEEKMMKMMTKISSALAIGSVAFIAKLRNEVLKDRKTKSNRRSWERLLSFEEVVRAVEEVRGESWDVFRSRRGDLGRGVVLSIARAHCGLTLQELEDKAEMSFDAVSKAVSRINKRMTVDRELKELHDLSVSKLGKSVRGCVSYEL